MAVASSYVIYIVKSKTEPLISYFLISYRLFVLVVYIVWYKWPQILAQNGANRFDTDGIENRFWYNFYV